MYFLSVLHLQYEHILLTSEYLEQISRKELYGYMYEKWFKNKILKKNKHTQGALHLREFGN